MHLFLQSVPQVSDAASYTTSSWWVQAGRLEALTVLTATSIQLITHTLS